MTKEYIESMLFNLGNLNTEKMTLSEHLLAAIALNAFKELLAREEEETK